MTQNKRKRDASQYIASMMQGNPKMLLAAAPIFQIDQRDLSFLVSSNADHFQARIRLPLPDGREAWGVGVAQTKKEAERTAAVDACKILNEMGFLVGENKGNPSTHSGWGENAKNILVGSVAFRNTCCGPNARPLPISVRSLGPDHSKVFVAELAVPLRGPREVYMAFGEGRSKAEAERACCYSACEKLYQEGILKKPGHLGGASVASINKVLQMQQHNEQPSIVVLRDNELYAMEDALHRLHLEMEGGFGQQVSPVQGDAMREEPRERSRSYAVQGDAMQEEPRERSRNCVSREQLAFNAILRLEAEKRLSSSKFTEQWQARQSQPAWRERHKIVDTIAQNRVVVLTGETGCGKTTQVPQYILELFELNGLGADVHIVVTQPRRIAAISVAERVAWERGEPVGLSVGYTIRLESVPPRPRGSILYCTTGVLLRKLQRSDGAAGITHIIIDEVHERDLETDFLLVVVRELLHHHTSLRVIIMSATLDSHIYTRYFDSCPAISIPGMMHPVQVYFLEDLAKLMDPYASIGSSFSWPGSSDDEEIDVDLVTHVLSWLVESFAKGDGALLCFLPGIDHIIMVRDQLQRMPSSRKMMILLLHSQLPAGEQRAAFTHAPEGLRKVVLATNIAETSVTIDDVVFVIDCGKVKEKHFDTSRNMNTMRVQWTSQASARQRQGRAGRVRSGFCFRLYSKQVFASMMEHPIPEMQRVPLEDLCLQIKAIATPNTIQEGTSTSLYLRQQADVKFAQSTTMNDIAMFLSKALQPPKAQAVFAAIKVLQELGAIDQQENLTALGVIIAKLAVPPRFGKMLVYAALLGSLDPVLTIAAAACFRDPFVAPIARRAEADHMRNSFAVGSFYGSDQLALVNAFGQWLAACSRGQGHAFCQESFLAGPTMRLIAGMRHQLKRTLAEAGVEGEWMMGTTEFTTVHLARCFLVAGLYPNIAGSEFCLESRGTKTSKRLKLGFKAQSGRVLIHPTSVVSEKQLNPDSHCYLVFQEKVQTSQVFIRGCTLLPPLSVVLLGWNVRVSMDPPPHGMSGDWVVLEVEGWLKFLMDRKSGFLLMQFREAFNRVVSRWLSGSAPKDAERHLVKVVVGLLEATCNDMFANVG